jgi:hypothetical protein
MQGGRHAAAVIKARLAGEPAPPFRFVDKGSLATIGRSAAVGQIGPLKLSGFVAWVLWWAVHLWYLIGFRNRFRVMSSWAWAYLTFQRGSRQNQPLASRRGRVGRLGRYARLASPATATESDRGAMADDLRATRLLSRQHGIITWDQALALGYTRHQIQGRVASGTWIRVARGVYRHHLQPSTWHNRLLTPCLASGTVASHRSSAALWQLDGCPRSRLEVVVEGNRRLRLAGVRVHRTDAWDQLGTVTIDGIPTTGIERTLIDLAGVVSDRRLRQAVDDARRRQLTDWPRLAAALDAHARPGRPGIVAFRALLDHYRGHNELPLSDWSNLVADLLVRAGLPRPVLEHPVTDGTGFRALLDLAYPSHRLALELDSLAWHFNHESFHRDPVRRNRLLVLGWRVLTVTWAEFAEHPDRLVATVRDALGGGFA